MPESEARTPEDGAARDGVAADVAGDVAGDAARVDPGRPRALGRDPAGAPPFARGPS